MASEADREYFACLALRHTPGLGPRTCKAVLDAYPSAFEALEGARAWPSRRLASARQAAAAAGETWRKDAEAEYRAARSLGLTTLTYLDPSYPDLLRAIPDPPVLLYLRGDAGLLAGPSVAVVGSRKASEEGLAAVWNIAADLSAAGLCVVSGMAGGIDRQAHLAGLSGVGSSVAVLGSGLDVVYPARNRDLFEELCAKGCVVSEFSPGTPPLAANFPVRNRIISGLSLAVVVGQAADKSGSLITAECALEQNREVFAIPGSPADPGFDGCNRLIQNGARLVAKAQDVVWALRFELGNRVLEGRPAGEGLRPAPGPAPEKPRAEAPPDLSGLSGELRRVAEAVPAGGRVHVDDLCRALDMDSAAVSAALLELEVLGLVRQHPGMRYGLAKGAGG